MMMKMNDDFIMQVTTSLVDGASLKDSPPSLSTQPAQPRPELQPNPKLSSFLWSNDARTAANASSGSHISHCVRMQWASLSLHSIFGWHRLENSWVEPCSSTWRTGYVGGDHPAWVYSAPPPPSSAFICPGLHSSI